jgi:nuclear pore complex protein Nup53
MKPSFLKRRSHASPPQSTQRLYVVVFGYPQDKYNATVEYFKSLGESTEPDQSLEVVNCFKIGFKDPTDAVRAVRRNGEVLGGSWMVGVKWAVSPQIPIHHSPFSTLFAQDPATAEAAIGQSTLWASTPGPLTSQSPLDPRFSDSPTAHQSPEPTIGTPIRLAPSASAFRKPMSRSGIDMQTHGDLIDSGAQGTTQGKGVLGQVSNLLFGW